MEIIKYSKLLEKTTLESIYQNFRSVLNKKSNIGCLVTEVKEEVARSVANRLAYLLILANESFGHCTRIEAPELIRLLIDSVLSRVGIY